MQTRRMVLLGGLGVTLGALPSRPLDGQSPRDSRPAVEAQYTQLRFDAGGRTLNADGIGARLMWGLAPVPAPVVGSSSAFAAIASRTALGLYATYTPDKEFAQGPGFSSLGLGAVADVRPFASPLAGRVDPFLSLGAGLLHTTVNRSVAPAPSPLLVGSRTAFAVTPGIGARVLLTPRLALQGDVRDLMTFWGDTRHNVALGAGLRLGF